jgi:hypothetical protein
MKRGPVGPDVPNTPPGKRHRVDDELPQVEPQLAVLFQQLQLLASLTEITNRQLEDAEFLADKLKPLVDNLNQGMFPADSQWVCYSNYVLAVVFAQYNKCLIVLQNIIKQHTTTCCHTRILNRSLKKHLESQTHLKNHPRLNNPQPAPGSPHDSHYIPTMPETEFQDVYIGIPPCFSSHSNF